MANFFLNFHSGWRFLVLLALVLNLVYFAYVLATKSGNAKQDKKVSLLFSIVSDTQLLLGLILLIIYIVDGGFDAGKHLGHFFPMLLAVAASHAHSIVQRRIPLLQTQRLVGLAAPIVALIFIFGGLAVLDGIGLFTMS